MTDDPRLPGEDPDEETEGQDAQDDIEDDAGLDDDEGGGDAAGEEETEEDAGEEGAVEPPKGRATRAVLEAKRIAREASERTAKLEQELQALRAERARPTRDTEAEEAARLSLMSPEERMEYRFAKAEERNQRQIALIHFQTADAADKATFQTKAQFDPRYKKYADDVERLLMSERQKGNNYDRETVFKFVLGEKVLQSKSQIKDQKAKGQQNVRRQQVQAPSGRSDRAAPRGRPGTGNSLSDLERRLENQEI